MRAGFAHCILAFLVPVTALTAVTTYALSGRLSAKNLCSTGGGRISGTDFPWLWQITVKLPDELQGLEDVRLGVVLRGNSSNKVVVKIR